MPEGPTRTGYLVECFWASVTAKSFVAAAEHARQATCDLRQQGHEVWFLGSILVSVDETVFFVFEGPEAQVRVASERAGLRFERVLESVQIERSRESSLFPACVRLR
jgi:hypothetical protein